MERGFKYRIYPNESQRDQIARTYSKTHSGLTADRFFGYYEGYDKAVAIRIYSVVPFKDSLELQTLNPELKRPPQSFCYVQSELDLPMKG